MRALVIYESMFGNTAKIAAAIVEGLEEAGADVIDRNVDDVAGIDPSQADLVVVGGPTHVHGMSRPTTRNTALEDATNTYDDPTIGDGLRGWLASLATVDGGAATAFDTRVDIPAFLSGAASKGIAHELERHGFRLVAERESFLVTKENTLVDGELARARAWGVLLGAATPVPG